jgi:hypothetical protein
MPMMPGPTAATITVRQVLDLLDNEFAEVAAAVGSRGFALWLGSGISLGGIPGVTSMLARALEHLRQKIEAGDPGGRYRRALDDALSRSCLSAAERAAVALDVPFDRWPRAAEIAESMPYAEVLDVRVEGEPDDYILWDAIDIRATFGAVVDPDCEHLCIAVLLMEGAIEYIASGNWDGLIEKAVELLSGEQLLQVIVDPNHLRDPTPRRGRLIKFHGCAIHAALDPAIYRRFLTGSQNQITFWPHNPIFIALRDVLVGLATNSRTLMIGLSLQDSDLQDIFARSRAANPWPWPPAPPPQGHVFCGNSIGNYQINMLRVVYQEAYGRDHNAIEASALIRAYSKQALLGFVLHLLTAKLSWLAARRCELALVGAAPDVAAGIRELRDLMAGFADGDRLTFLNSFIDLWSRGLMMFRRGELPPSGSAKYEVISPLSAPDMANDPNIAESGLLEMAVGLGLLGRGQTDGKWTLAPPASAGVEYGVFQATGAWTATKMAQIFFVRSAPAAIRLIDQGALKNENDIILHSDDAYVGMPELGGNPGVRSPTAGVLRRTGRPKPRHVSMRSIIRDATDFATLKQRFEEEMTL